MKTIGLTDSEIQTLIAIISAFPSVSQALIFGSRALGTYKTGSDIDIALKGSVGLDEVSRIKARIEEETLLPYFVDVVAYDSLENPDLVAHIDAFGKVVYERV